MKRVKFWSRLARGKSYEWMLSECKDYSRVPVKAWKSFNKAFWQWKYDGLLWPLDELDAYQFAAGEMVKASEKLADITLTRATRSTYLVSAAFHSLMKYRDRQVQPVRDEYRALHATARVSSAGSDHAVSRGEDKSDREWLDKSSSTCDVSAFVESLPGTHSFDRVNVLRLASECVYGTYMKLDRDARRGLRCWLMADGVWVDAANIYGCSRPWYLAMFKYRWAPAFRAACEWQW